MPVSLSDAGIVFCPEGATDAPLFAPRVSQSVLREPLSLLPRPFVRPRLTHKIWGPYTSRAQYLVEERIFEPLRARLSW